MRTANSGGSWRQVASGHKNETGAFANAIAGVSGNREVAQFYFAVAELKFAVTPTEKSGANTDRAN
jgi:hypothetical protein